MVSTASKIISFDDFITWLPERSEYRYELRDGEILEMPKPRGEHSEIAGFIISDLNFIIRQSPLPYLIPRESIGKDSGLKSLSAIVSRYTFGEILLNIAQIILSITEPQTMRSHHLLRTRKQFQEFAEM